MLPNKVTGQISSEEQQAIMESLRSITAKFPSLISLSNDVKKSLIKIGPKSLTFTTRALELAKKNPDFLPRSFDTEEFGRDLELYQKLYSINQELSKLLKQADNTLMQVGSEAYLAALAVYQFAKNSKVGTAGLEGVIDDLGKIFGRKTTPPKDETK